MIGHFVKFNNFDFTKKGVVESAEYTSLSVTPLYFERAEKIAKFRRFQKSMKEVKINFRVFAKKISYRENEKYVEGLIAELFSEEVQILQINYKHCRAILAEADYSIINNAILIELKFLNLDGMWYSEEKTSKNGKIENQGIMDSEFLRITVKPTINTVIIKDNRGHVLEIKPENTNYDLVVDMEEKTVKQSGEYVEITEESVFFKLKKGQNNVTIKGGTAIFTYREVMAL